jgi:hypothetical protein
MIGYILVISRVLFHDFHTAHRAIKSSERSTAESLIHHERQVGEFPKRCNHYRCRPVMAVYKYHNQALCRYSRILHGTPQFRGGQIDRAS